jgi:hypothetical protein
MHKEKIRPLSREKVLWKAGFLIRSEAEVQACLHIWSAYHVRLSRINYIGWSAINKQLEDGNR